MKQASVIRHVPFEDLGNLGPILEQRGFQIAYLEAGLDELFGLTKSPPDLLVILGGPIGVYQEVEYPFLRDELQVLEQRLAADMPTLGICLGSQLMTRALGARVYPGTGKEIGWAPLSLTDAGIRSCLSPLGSEDIHVLHWHGDTFDLPPQAIGLASTEYYKNQGFTWGRNCLALQFHPEVTADGLERWFIGHACEIALTPNVSVPKLREDTARYAHILQEVAQGVWTSWLQAIS